MEEDHIKNNYISGNSPFRLLMDHFGNKWSMILIVALSKKGEMRFNELDKSVEGISQKVLTSTLRALEEAGFVCRKTYCEVPPRVDYSLTDLGRSLLAIIEWLVKWSYQHQDAILKKRK